MKIFIEKFIAFIILCSLMIGGYCKLAAVATEKYIGANTEDLINTSFKNSINDKYNCYFLGNSRIYRNINPDMFTSVNAYNFGHDNDSYNQMYYKLLYLLDNDEPIEYLIIGTDYFQFSFLADTRNYVYADLFPMEYQDDFGKKTWLTIKKEYYIRLWSNKQNSLESCIKYILNRPKPLLVNYQKENGQYVVSGEANPNDTIDRDYSILDVQYEYFEKIINLCIENNIDLYIIMPPLWEGETSSHSEEERAIFNRMILDELEGTPFEGHYINYSMENGLSPYTDFIDITHLKPSVADRYSEYINSIIFGENY